MAEPTVLILGGGGSGVATARELRRLTPSSTRIVLIDKEERASYRPSFAWVMTGQRRPEAISRDRNKLLRSGIEFVHAEVRQIDTGNRYVRADSREFRYDYLVLALGSEPDYEATPGLAETSQSIESLDSAERLAATLRYFSGGRIALIDGGWNAKQQISLYEAAMLLEQSFHARRMRQKVEIDIYTPESTPLPFAGEQVNEEMLGLLAHKGIGFHGDTRLSGVDAGKRELHFDSGAASFQVLISWPEQRAPQLLADCGLAGAAGWAAAHRATLETATPDVFAVGSCASIELQDGRALPRLTFLADLQGRAAARQIAVRSGNGEFAAPFIASGRHLLETGGGAAAVFKADFSVTPYQVEMGQPSLAWHWARTAQERLWLWQTF